MARNLLTIPLALLLVAVPPALLGQTAAPAGAQSPAPSAVGMHLAAAQGPAAAGPPAPAASRREPSVRMRPRAAATSRKDVPSTSHRKAWLIAAAAAAGVVVAVLLIRHFSGSASKCQIGFQFCGQ
jgi:hypothetical protein